MTKIALTLPGGGMTASLYQVGALAALEDGVHGIGAAHELPLYVGHGSGATVAAALAGGIPVTRLYRALLDPVDVFFPLERGHILHLDLDEYRRTVSTAWVALRTAASRLRARRDAPTDESSQKVLLAELDRLSDSLPAGLFTLNRYERFLAEFFMRRGIPNSFRAMPHALRIPAHDVDTGERVVFGSPGYEDVPVSLACAASMAIPLFFSPVRVGSRHYLEGGLGKVAHFDIARDAGVELSIVVSPLTPVSAAGSGVPTGHGLKGSVRDKGLLWMFNQSMRIGAHARLHFEMERVRDLEVITLEPEPTDAMLFLHNPAKHEARRAILEYAYKTTRERIAHWIDVNHDVADRMGWRAA